MKSKHEPHIILGIWPISFYPVTVNDWTMQDSEQNWHGVSKANSAYHGPVCVAS